MSYDVMVIEKPQRQGGELVGLIHDRQRDRDTHERKIVGYICVSEVPHCNEKGE